MAAHGVWETEFESGDIQANQQNLLERIISGKRVLGAPKYSDAAVQKYIQNFNQYIKYPYNHHVGQYQEVEGFDNTFNAADGGLLSTADNLRELEEKGKTMRQQLTDICYMTGISEEDIPRMVGTKVSTTQLWAHLQAEEKRKRKEIEEMNKELKKMSGELASQGDTIYKVDLVAPEHAACTNKIEEYGAMRELSVAGNNVIKSQYDTEISDLKADMVRMHAVEGDLELDMVELELREARMAKIVPSVNCFASWLTKNNAILLNVQARSIGNNSQYVKREAGFERRYESADMDPFWESMDAPWDHSIGEGWFSPTIEEVKAKRQQELEEEEEEERVKTTTIVHTGLVEEEEVEIPIVFAEKPFMITFGDPRALRPVYFPSAGTQAAALVNAFHHIGVGIEDVVDGNDFFFGDMKAIGPGDSTKMELLRRIILEQLLVHPNPPEEGGNLEKEVNNIKRPVANGDMTLIMQTFDRHERLERECIEKYKLPTQNTFLYERHCEEGGQNGEKFPPYIENFEVWFGDKLPPMENARRRFGFYDVRKRSKKPDKQKLLWTGIVFTREDDVQKVKQILKDEVGAVKPLFEDVEDTGDKKFHLANIVGRAKQRRWADAFVRFDLEREGSLPADKVFEIIRGRKYDHCLGVQVPLAQLEEQWDEMFPEVDRVVDSLTYAEYEEFVMEVSDSFEKDNGENAFFREKRKQQLRETYEADLINMFNRYDWDKSNSLEVKEVYGILGELQFSDIDAEMVEALVDQYDRDGNGAVDQEEFLELALDALLTLGSDGSLIGSIVSYFNSGPKMSMGVERDKKTRVALWFDEADSADNDLADVDLTPLGDLNIINGFEVMCRAADMNVNKADRKTFYDDKFRMELVRMLFMRAFIYVDKTSNKQIFGEKTTVNLEAQLSSFGHPDGCLSKEAFMEMIRDYKLHEAKRAEYKQPAMGPRNLLEKMNGDEDLWRNCAMHVKFCDMVEVQSNDEVIAPSPKAGSRFDFYTCRPDDIKTDNGISWILIVFNEDKDIEFLKTAYGQYSMEK